MEGGRAPRWLATSVVGRSVATHPPMLRRSRSLNQPTRPGKLQLCSGECPRFRINTSPGIAFYKTGKLDGRESQIREVTRCNTKCIPVHLRSTRHITSTHGCNKASSSLMSFLRLSSSPIQGSQTATPASHSKELAVPTVTSSLLQTGGCTSPSLHLYSHGPRP